MKIDNSINPLEKEYCSQSKKQLKDNFISYILQQRILKFGEFTLKSGRKSPYFFNAGLFNTGASLKLLSNFYADTLIQNKILDFDVIYGPAYKGITLASSTAIALSDKIGKEIAFTYDRKEEKTRGEGGIFVGASIKNKRLLLIDDVVSAGTTVCESKAKIASKNAKINNMIIALDRCEKINPSGNQIASEEIFNIYGVKVYSIINIYDILDFLQNKNSNFNYISALKKYLNQYGITN